MSCYKEKWQHCNAISSTGKTLQKWLGVTIDFNFQVKKGVNTSKIDLLVRRTPLINTATASTYIKGVDVSWALRHLRCCTIASHKCWP